MPALDGLTNLLFYFSVFWATLHGAFFLLRRARSSGPLPLPGLPSLRRRTSYDQDTIKAGSLTITLRKANLRVQSTALNASHDVLARSLARGRARRVLGAFYDLGSILGVIGMLGSFVLLLWTAVQLISGLSGARDAVSGHLHDVVSAPAQTVRHKRHLEPADFGAATTGPQSSSELPLHIIIPGVTVPLTHLPLLLAALLASQVIHEAGHAITAAIDSVPLLSTGASLTLLLPSAFVALPASATRALPAPARLRLIAAGAFHNLLLYLFLVALAHLGLGAALWGAAGYTDVARFGRVVTRVAELSPLATHLPPGVLILKLDDQPLIQMNAGTAADTWVDFLSASGTAPSAPARLLGWCVDRAWFEAQPHSCCASAPISATDRSAASLACFQTRALPPTDRCVDPLPVLDDTPSAADPASAPRTRCTNAVDCGGGALCVAPRGDQELFRITFRSRTDPTDQVLIWNGPLAEVLEDIAVSTWLPRWEFLPLQLPPVVNVFFSYLKMITLSLYFLNLLPLPALDGAHFLEALLDWLGDRGTPIDGIGLSGLGTLESGLDAANTTDVGRRALTSVPWKPKAQRAIQVTAMSLVGACILLGVMNALR
ncbi:hypothetical protein CERSUDRAFT_99509 [Gelatoporia subvermispora B]|uniref:Endopeptidase S2P n=1 Tax=Ceriporiopsis subvermispora (strain B) TaxID=914234 RepID=M2QK08_CERS8|nr:hypothetical protein CERSUDRAFT_99509 [Gelatoporia subvermispora B]